MQCTIASSTCNLTEIYSKLGQNGRKKGFAHFFIRLKIQSLWICFDSFIANPLAANFNFVALSLFIWDEQHKTNPLESENLTQKSRPKSSTKRHCPEIVSGQPLQIQGSCSDFTGSQLSTGFRGCGSKGRGLLCAT